MAFIISSPAYGGISCGISEDLSLEEAKIYRGDPINFGIPQPSLAIYKRKNSKIPNLFFFYDDIYLCCSEIGRDFLEKYAPDNCDFFAADAHYGRGGESLRKAKLGAKLENEYFFLNTKFRLDTIDWLKSDAKAENAWVYRTYTDEKIWGTDIRWPILDNLGIGNVFYGLVIRKNLRNGAHIWREHMAGWQTASCIFISDEMKNQIEKEKLGKFDFIPVMEI